MDEKVKGFFQIFLSIIVSVIIIFEGGYLKQFSSLNYVGVLIISFASSATLFIPAPSWIFVIIMGRLLDPYLVGVIAGIGSGFGEITGYIAGKGTSRLVQMDGKYRENWEWIRKKDVGAIAILAFIPNPLFDIAGFAAGNLGIKVWRFILGCIIGRVLKYVLLAYIGKFSEYM